MRNPASRWRRSIAIGTLCSGALFTTTACGADNNTSGVVSDVQDKAGDAKDKAGDQMSEMGHDVNGGSGNAPG